MKTILIILSLTILLSCTEVSQCQVLELEQDFLTSPDSAKPWVWSRWSGYVTRAGIRADLEALAQQGFGGFVVDFSERRTLFAKGIKGNNGPQWEANKCSKVAVESFLSGFFEKLVSDPRAKLLLGTTWTGVHLDSWECSNHRWSDDILFEWEKRMSYALEPWLPALLGFTVNSPEETRCFLWDYERIRSDMIGDLNYNTIQDRLHILGMKFDAECTHFDRMKSWKYGDIPTTEFSPKGDHGGAGRLLEGIQTGAKMTSSAQHFMVSRSSLWKLFWLGEKQSSLTTSHLFSMVKMTKT